MPKIQQLAPQLADMIAAGEVVERPASAAKELVENSIDAGAKKITIEIKNGGMTFLRVTDDGCGIPAAEAETAFLRHATSKLSCAEDLESIHTLGFRGEALAAISSVSRIDLITRTAREEFGTSLHLEAGVVTDRTEAGGPRGTTIIVRDLFYNTPARMKFMKRDTVEASALLTAVQRLAIAHPEVSIRVVRDGEEQLNTPGDGDLMTAIYSVLGRQAARSMVPVDSHWEQYRLRGFTSLPTATRGRRDQQLFFVNGRHVRSGTMTAALEEAYRNQLMVGRFPCCVLHLTMPEHLVDVNVHPAKTEVRFLRERDIFDCLCYGVRGALERASGRVPMQMPGNREKDAPGEQGTPQERKPLNTTLHEPRQEFFRTMSAADFRAVSQILQKAPPPAPGPSWKEPGRRGVPENSHGTLPPAFGPPQVKKPAPPVPEHHPEGEPAPDRREMLPQSRETEEKIPEETFRTALHPVVQAPVVQAPAVQTPVPQAPPAEKPSEPLQEEDLLPQAPDWRMVGEVMQTYVIVEQGKSMLLIDKHAAHERILFEKFRKNPEPVVPQLLLTPILCSPEPETAALLLEHEQMLGDYGFCITDYGDGVLAVSQIPADLAPDQVEDTLGQMAQDLRLGRHVTPEELRDNMLHTIACKAAIKGGRHTDPLELQSLVAEVLSRQDIKYCPHGRPVCIELTEAQLEHQFKRA